MDKFWIREYPDHSQFGIIHGPLNLIKANKYPYLNAVLIPFNFWDIQSGVVNIWAIINNKFPKPFPEDLHPYLCLEILNTLYPYRIIESINIPNLQPSSIELLNSDQGINEHLATVTNVISATIKS